MGSIPWLLFFSKKGIAKSKNDISIDIKGIERKIDKVIDKKVAPSFLLFPHNFSLLLPRLYYPFYIPYLLSLVNSVDIMEGVLR